MSAPTFHRPHRTFRLPQILGDRRGTAAIEFGVLGGLLMLFTGFAVEMGVDLFMQATLDRAVQKESRLIRTGAITSSGQTQFTSNICADVQFLMNCSKLQINVASGSSFAGLSSAIPTSSTNQMTTTGFSPGSSGQDVIVQVGYTRALFFRQLTSLVGKGGNVLIWSSAAFQNEPF